MELSSLHVHMQQTVSADCVLGTKRNTFAIIYLETFHTYVYIYCFPIRRGWLLGVQCGFCEQIALIICEAGIQLCEMEFAHGKRSQGVESGCGVRL